MASVLGSALRGRAIWAAVSNRPARFSARSARSCGCTQAWLAGEPAGGLAQGEPGDQPGAEGGRGGLGPGIETGQRVLGGGERGEQRVRHARRQAAGSGAGRPGAGRGVGFVGQVLPDRAQCVGRLLGLVLPGLAQQRVGVRVLVPGGAVGVGHGDVPGKG